MSEKVLLKLGGSVITDKSGECAIDFNRIRFISRQISESNPGSLFIVHGAGSCGHPEAHRYHIRSGVSMENRQGVYITHKAVRHLNDTIVTLLREEGTEAVGISPLAGGFADNGRLVYYPSQHLERMSDLGIVPVLHGDVVMDSTRGACIVSGDQLVSYLGARMGRGRIGLATDVPGLLDGDLVVPEITPEMMDSVRIGESAHTDVTGGMKGKIGELLELARLGVSSHIFHVSRLGDFLTGLPHGGTIVRGSRDD